MGILTNVPKAFAFLSFTIVNLYPTTYIKYEFDLKFFFFLYKIEILL